MLHHILTFFLIVLFALPAQAEKISTKYLSVDLPENWKVVMPPSESQAYSTVIFANATGTATVAFVAGPNGGVDAKTIATMFAEQFHAPRAPYARRGQQTFTFTQQNTVHQAWVATVEDAFLLSTLSGDRKEALAFIRNCVTSPAFPELLPR